MKKLKYRLLKEIKDEKYKFLDYSSAHVDLQDGTRVCLMWGMYTGRYLETWKDKKKHYLLNRPEEIPIWVLRAAVEKLRELKKKRE